ncbi:hypothetical protein AB1N83_013412 [Pleurotus pulmonarius]
MLVHSWIVALVLCLHSHIRSAEAGQVPTNGLSIVNSPQPDTPVHNSISLSVQLPVDTSQSDVDSLAVYLISASSGLNLTVSPDLVKFGSDRVKNFPYSIPSCATPGAYDLTFLETSHEGDQRFFHTTSIPVQVDGTEGSDALCVTNTPQEPQSEIPGVPDTPQAPPPEAPGLPNKTPLANVAGPAATPSSTKDATTLDGQQQSVNPPEPSSTPQGPLNLNSMTTSASATSGISEGVTTTRTVNAPSATVSLPPFFLLLPVSGARPQASFSTVQLALSGAFVPIVLVMCSH